jgi:hypothetical protein
LTLAADHHSSQRALSSTEPHQWIYFFAGCLCLLSMMSSSFLFLQRVLAIYNGNKRIRIAFCIFWFLVSCSDIVMPFGAHEETTLGISENQGYQPWVSLSTWCLFLFDSAVIVAVSYRILSSYSISTGEREASLYNLLTGRTLPSFSRAIFQGGLQYYL